MSTPPASGRIDLHNHLLPGVDDGAADDDQARTALRAMREQGVRALVTTPHLDGSLTLAPDRLAARLAELDAGWARLRAIVDAEFPDVRVERGAEVMLDTPAPDLSDPRARLGGTSFVLVELPYMNVPPNSASTVYGLKMKGHRPIVAHPERYEGVDRELAMVDEWRRVGGHLQVNTGSLLGRYGTRAEHRAWRLLELGWADYLASDYHARGDCTLAAGFAAIEGAGGEAVARALTRNAERLLHDDPPEPVPPLERKRGWMARLWPGKR